MHAGEKAGKKKSKGFYFPLTILHSCYLSEMLFAFFFQNKKNQISANIMWWDLWFGLVFFGGAELVNIIFCSQNVWREHFDVLYLHGHIQRPKW